MRHQSPALKAFVIAFAVLSAVPASRAAARQGGARGLSVNLEGEQVRLYDASYALVIGISDYTNGWPKLPGVKLDVQAVGDALKRQGFEVETLMNPTRDDFDRGVRGFIGRRGQAAGNRLLIYFAGHGHTITTVDGRELGYIVPAEAPNPNRGGAGAFKQSAISMDEIEVYARQIESKHALFIFDSCFSGSLFEASRSIPPAIVKRTALPVRQFITAGTADQEVPDRSIFREQFVEALGGEADSNGDGYVTGSELGAFLEDRVTNYTNRAQTPRWGKIRNPNLDKGDFVFVSPKMPSAPKVASGPAQLPPSVQLLDPAAIELSFWETIKNSSDPEDFKAYLEQYPNGRFASLARRRAQPASPPPSAAQPRSAEIPGLAGTRWEVKDSDGDVFVFEFQAAGELTLIISRTKQRFGKYSWKQEGARITVNGPDGTLIREGAIRGDRIEGKYYRNNITWTATKLVY